MSLFSNLVDNCVVCMADFVIKISGEPKEGKKESFLVREINEVKAELAASASGVESIVDELVDSVNDMVQAKERMARTKDPNMKAKQKKVLEETVAGFAAAAAAFEENARNPKTFSGIVLRKLLAKIAVPVNGVGSWISGVWNSVSKALTPLKVACVLHDTRAVVNAPAF